MARVRLATADAVEEAGDDDDGDVALVMVRLEVVARVRLATDADAAEEAGDDDDGDVALVMVRRSRRVTVVVEFIRLASLLLRAVFLFLKGGEVSYVGIRRTFQHVVSCKKLYICEKILLLVCIGGYLFVFVIS